jgi:integrase
VRGQYVSVALTAALLAGCATTIHNAPINRPLRKAFKHAVRLAKLEGGITPHTLRHTAATWLMQRGVDLWQAAGFLGMSVETLERNYGHHHPTYMQEAARAIGYGHGKRVSLAERDLSRSKSRKID